MSAHVTVSEGATVLKMSTRMGSEIEGLFKTPIDQLNDMRYLPPVLKFCFYRCLKDSDIYVEYYLYEVLK